MPNTHTTSSTDNSNKSSRSTAAARRTYLIVGVVAAAVSAATAGYVFWSRQRKLLPQVETVQDLLDRCHSQVRSIEQRLHDLRSATT